DQNAGGAEVCSRRLRIPNSRHSECPEDALNKCLADLMRSQDEFQFVRSCLVVDEWRQHLHIVRPATSHNHRLRRPIECTRYRYLFGTAYNFEHAIETRVACSCTLGDSNAMQKCERLLVLHEQMSKPLKDAAIKAPVGFEEDLVRPEDG